MITYESLPPHIEQLLWDYAKTMVTPEELLEPLTETEEEQNDREQRLYEFLSRRRQLVFTITTQVREYVDKTSRKYVPSAILADGSFLPWYKFPSGLGDFTLIKDMKSVVHTPVEIPLLGAVQRLSEIGIHLTPEQMLLVRRQQAYEATQIVPPRTTSCLKKHTTGIHKPREQKEVELKIPTSQSGLLALLQALQGQGINLNIPTPKETEHGNQ